MNPAQTIRPTLGLALSGGGNRSSFYIGFLEVLVEQKVPIDYIAACSGGSLVAAAFACGSLEQFKQTVLTLDQQTLKSYFVRSKGKGGFFSTELLEGEILKFTKGYRFEDVRPLMGFVAVDINTGEKVLLSMGDIARAALVSCTLPGVFEPSQWGDKTLVDGGLLTMVPGDFVKKAGIDISIGINMRGTKHIFKESQLNMKMVYNFLKRIFFVDQIDSFLNNLFNVEENNTQGLFEVIGKSLDLAIKANKNNDEHLEKCDLTILPEVPLLTQDKFGQSTVKYYYDEGRKCAKQYVPEIQNLIKNKQKAMASEIKQPAI